LLLHKATQSGDLKQLIDIVLKYSLGCICTIIITHMEGEEIFGSCKQKANLTPKLKGDSHKHDRVNFSHPCVNHTITNSKCEHWKKFCWSNWKICWGPWSSMWRWSLAYNVACSMFHFAKIHQAFLCYKDNYQVNLYWCPYLTLLNAVVSIPWCTFKVA